LNFTLTTDLGGLDLLGEVAGSGSYDQLLPALAPTSTVALYFTPVLWFGCVNRGLLALAIVLTSAAGAFVAIGRRSRARARREPPSGGS